MPRLWTAGQGSQPMSTGQPLAKGNDYCGVILSGAEGDYGGNVFTPPSVPDLREMQWESGHFACSARQ